MSTRIHIMLPEETLAAVDRARGDVSRSRWLLRAVERSLGAELGLEAPQPSVPDRPRTPPVPMPDPDRRRPVASKKPVGDLQRAISEREAWARAGRKK